MNHRTQSGKNVTAISLCLLCAACTLPAQQPDHAVQNHDDKVWTDSVRPYDKQRAALLKTVDAEDQSGPFRPDWGSLEHYQVPTWYQDAKFGIFIHWGLYSVPSFGNEWYSRNMYIQDTPEFKHHVATYGPQTTFGYKDFIPKFKAEHFDPHAWAALFHDAGAQYVVPVAEHHDGFPLYNSNLTPWSAAKMGPKRDIVGELATAVRAQGLHFGASTHRAEHYFFMNGGRTFPSDVQDPKYASFYGPAHAGITPGKDEKGHPDPAYLDDWLARTTEIVQKYKPEIIYFDWWIEQPEFQPYLKRFAAFYYNDAAARHSTAIINAKNKTFPPGTAIFDIERGVSDTIRPMLWQTDTSVSNKSWGYIEDDTFKSPQTIVWQLADIVSKNGNLLLNVGPRPDGTIPDPIQHILREVGAWLKVNGEGIYGTRPWTVYGEGPTRAAAGSFHDGKDQYTPEDLRFTKKGTNLYAIALAWPTSGTLTIHTTTKQAAPAKDVTLLGSNTKLKWTQDATGLTIHLPQQPIGTLAYTFRIALQP